MKDWNTQTIAELGKVVTGKTPPSAKPEQFGDEYPFITPSDIQFGNKHVTTERFLSQRGLDAHKRIKLPKKTVCVVCIGATIGKVCAADQVSISNQQINSIIVDADKHDPDFVFYLATLLRSTLEAYAGGAATPIVNKGAFSKIKLRIPERDIQRKIAAILTAYDDLIETNKRRIALLEKMAEEIYREWFVRMRFPGHQSTKFLKGVPEGWGEVELGDICDEASRSTKAGEHLSDRYYLPLDALGTRQMLPTDHYDYTAAQSSLALFDKGDILFGAMRPYQHKVVIAPFDGVTRTTMFVIRPKEDWLHAYCYLNLFQNSSIEYATLICNGADRPYVVWNRAMERMKVFLPKEPLLVEFEKLAGPILASISDFYFIQRKLVEARDLLLPRLISGKLSVEDLDIQFPPSMREES